MSAYDIPVGFHFKVEFDLPGILEKDYRFREVTGMSLEMEEETVIEGGQNRFVQKLPVRAKQSDVTLKRGLILDSVVYEWCKQAIQNFDIQPTMVWIKLLNEQHEPLQTYTLINAWPKKWSISDFNAESSELVIESLDLAYQYLTID